MELKQLEYFMVACEKGSLIRQQNAYTHPNRMSAR